MTMYAALANAARPRRSSHLAFSFNYTTLPRGVLRRVQSLAFKSVDRFVVFSNVERHLYSEYFDLDPHRIDMIRWAVNAPEVSLTDQPVVPGHYVCAVGSQGRDYGLLFEAMKLLPTTRLVVVATPDCLAGLETPSNVEVRIDIPLRDAQNIIANSQLMVLPLRDNRVPCGHVTLVSAMYLGRAIIATDSSGIADYLQEGVTGRLVPAHHAVRLAHSIDELLGSPLTRERLGAEARTFAKLNCCEQVLIDYLETVLPSLSEN